MKRTAKQSASESEDLSREAERAQRPPAEGADLKDVPQGTRATPELRVSDILEAFPFYVMLVDDRHRILQANAAVQEQLGLAPEDVVGKYCPRVIHGIDGPWYACPLEEAAETGEAVEREVLDRATGRWVRSAIFPTARFTAGGRRIYFHAVADITEAKQVEDQLRASRERCANFLAFSNPFGKTSGHGWRARSTMSSVRP